MSKAQPKAQRVGVFVDVQNMYYSARHIYNSKVNFKALLNEAVQGRTLVRAMAYVVRSEDVAREEFFKVLGNLGYEVKVKDVQVFVDGSKKADWDIGIAMDMIELAPRMDTLVLISGDGDFVPLVEHLQRAMGCRVEVIAFGKSSAAKLKDAADAFTDIDASPKKFLISRLPHSAGRPGEIETHHSGMRQRAPIPQGAQLPKEVVRSARGHRR
jgi:uncharacterized LabA/DUF88 family protein